MTQLNDAPSVHSASLTGSQLATAQRLWNLAELPPVSGYGSAILAIGLGSDPVFADSLLSVDFDSAASVADAVDVLRRWRQRTFG
ncbi:MAG TPA: hypothetical protein VFE86_11715 [Ilumatobacteraceae bacterium]|nr:hypothetical protein [Ilumatobacteraceae bacterium]